MKTIIIVQARMTSTRLPGKVLKPVLDKPLLEYQIERLQRVRFADEIVIATTINATDQPIVEWCDRRSIAYVRGDEVDVLGRYYTAAIAHQGEVIVRITSDCPLIDPAVIDQGIQYYLAHQTDCDYVSNCSATQRTYPRGMDVEVFPFRCLREAFLEASSPTEREHVTPFIYTHLQRYRLALFNYSSDQSHHRWTVDTLEDFELIRRILETLYPTHPTFTLEDVLALLAHHSDWVMINAHIQQKRL